LQCFQGRVGEGFERRSRKGTNPSLRFHCGVLSRRSGSNSTRGAMLSLHRLVVKRAAPAGVFVPLAPHQLRWNRGRQKQGHPTRLPEASARATSRPVTGRAGAWIDRHKARRRRRQHASFTPSRTRTRV
jgi:hypothetical protein